MTGISAIIAKCCGNPNKEHNPKNNKNPKYVNHGRDCSCKNIDI